MGAVSRFCSWILQHLYASSRILNAMPFPFLETGPDFLFVLRILIEAIPLLFHAWYVFMETKKEILFFKSFCIILCVWRVINAYGHIQIYYTSWFSGHLLLILHLLFIRYHTWSTFGTFDFLLTVWCMELKIRPLLEWSLIARSLIWLIWWWNLWIPTNTPCQNSL